MYIHYIKPLVDILGAILLLIVLSPLFILVAILIYFKIGRPILFKQTRPGKDEKLFDIYKFRTMQVQKAGESLSDEDRMLPFGKRLRSLSLDELPQLFNVLKGQMSFIGPRPLLIEYLNIYNSEQKKRHQVKPGISGWAQVNGRNAISWKEKLEYDVWYTKHMSFSLDMKIVILTIKKVLLRKDISAAQHVTSEKFNGHN